jgi:stage II sporulation protein D
MRKFTTLAVAVALTLTTAMSAPVYAKDDNKVMDSIAKAYVLSATDLGSAISYQMLVDGEVKTFYTHNKSFAAQPGSFVSFKAKQDRIVDFRDTVAVAQLREKIMAKDTAGKTLDLELTGPVKLADSYQVFQTINGQTVPKSLNDVYVGAENVNVFLNEFGQVDLIVIDGKTPTDEMRVGIMTGGFASLDHSKLDFRSAGGMKVVDKKAGLQYDIAPNEVATFVNTTNGITVSVNGTELFTSQNRLYVEPASESLIQITTFSRAYGNPSYRGSFEITPSATEGKLNLINEVDLEQYLYQVVPSEMPASFGLEALKAQSVAARTYAMSDYYSNRYAKKGFHVDDSTLSQVYNNSAESPLHTQAVNETRGIIMEHDGQLVDARYYSTSGGYGASKHEVWADAGTNQFPGTPIPYLTARSYTYDPADRSKIYEIDTQDEAALNAFYKDLTLTGYDSASYYFRWKVTFSKLELENTINSNLAARYAADPAFILTKDASGNFVSKPIPANGIGQLKNLYVTKRGQGGNMMELVIEGTTGTYKIVKEYNIRFTIRPSKTYTLGQDVLLYRAKGGSQSYDLGYTLKNYSILPSAFATFDIARDESGNVTSVTFYGGGNGHGAGMSQYGASMLGLSGWSYDQILNAYYGGMELVNVYQN